METITDAEIEKIRERVTIYNKKMRYQQAKKCFMKWKRKVRGSTKGFTKVDKK
jgi:hypothetical protein